MTTYTPDQLWYLDYAEEKRLDLTVLSDPDYSPDRMDAIVTALEEHWEPLALELLRDKKISDYDALRIQYHLLNGGTLDDFILDFDRI